MSYLEKIISDTAQSPSNFTSMVNKGDLIQIRWDGGINSLQVIDIAIDLNNSRILPSEIVIVFIFGLLNEKLELTDARIRTTNSQFKYIKHLSYSTPNEH
jgi:hypothetical protein